MTRRLFFFALFCLSCTPRESTYVPPPQPAPYYSPPTPRVPAAGTQPAPQLPVQGSPGCARRSLRSGTQRANVGGQARTYTTVVPDQGGPYPVVFTLHGDGGNGAGIRSALGLEPFAAGRAVFVYPDSPGGWDLDGAAGVSFFDAMLFTIANEACVDLRRVFVIGFSNGAYMANQLGCRRGDRIRAVATFAGGGPYETQGGYDAQGRLVCPGKAVASMVIHGLADNVVAPSEGQKSVDHWTYANRCAGGTTPTQPAGCLAVSGCPQPVVVCRIQGLGHAVWPEGRRAAWAFFDALK